MRFCIELAFRVLGWIVDRGGFRLRWLMGSAIGIVWFDIFRIRRRVALENLQFAFPELSEKQKVKLARQSLVHLGISITEYGLLSRLNRSNFQGYFRFFGLEKFAAAQSHEKGVLLLAMHIGNGDLGSAGLSLKGIKINLVSKQFRYRPLNDAWFGMRREQGTHLISPEKSSFEILRALKRKEAVVFVLDQFMGPPVGVETTFFGRSTGTAAGLATIAQRSEAPVLPCFTFRRADGVHDVIFDDPIPWTKDEGHEKDDIRVMTQRYTDKIESIVRSCPQQWMWIHRRWKEFSVR